MSETLLDNLAAPRFLYGTAWKEDATQSLVELAIKQGFRGIDTANQRKHYYEAAVGAGVQAMIAQSVVKRSELFLQTKFTFQAGQDHRLPYDPAAPIATQVEQSFASSLAHLGVEALDSYVLHGPSQRPGLGSDDWAAWHAMEKIHEQGGARMLGVSNVTAGQLLLLCEKARVRPSFVQNRCYAVRGWDADVREICREYDVVYQGFSLLTANRELQTHSELVRIAKRHGRTVSQIIFRFALDIGMLPLTGTKSAEHMREDLDVLNFALSAEEVALIETVG